MIPISTVDTAPFCGSCGFELTALHSLTPALICDACGADLRAFGFGGLIPPEAPVGTPGSGSVSFAFTVNPEADLTQSSESVDGALAVWSDFSADTSPTVVSAVAGTLVGLRVRSVLNGIPGPYTESSGTTGA